MKIVVITFKVEIQLTPAQMVGDRLMEEVNELVEQARGIGEVLDYDVEVEELD